MTRSMRGLYATAEFLVFLSKLSISQCVSKVTESRRVHTLIHCEAKNCTLFIFAITLSNGIVF